jgi:aminoglycoside phosphotransferase (APT) family kinase protein
LPPPPERVLAAAETLIPGAGPAEVAPSSAGLVNESYRVMRDGRAYSLRMPGPRTADLGQDRSWECRVLERAGAAGLSPPLELCDAGRGIIVARWMEGDAWTRADALQPANLARAASLLRRVHRLEIPVAPRRMSPKSWIAHYAAALEQAGGVPPLASSLAARAGQYLDTLSSLPAAAPVLCHSDLHVDNVLDTGPDLMLLDWEYAHVSDPFWDVAGWACNNDMGDRDAWLAEYLGRLPEPHETRRLGVHAWLYDYVCLLWSELFLRSRPAGDVAERARCLGRRLSDPSGYEPSSGPAE